MPSPDHGWRTRASRIRFRMNLTVATLTVAACTLTALATVTGPEALGDDHVEEPGPAVAAAGGGVHPADQAATRTTAPDAVSASDTARAPLAAIEPRDRDVLVYVGDDGEQITVERVRRYLERRGSPLAAHADAFVEAGVANDVDPRVVIAISAAESGFGRRQLGHNAWGWGASTTAKMKRWPDWNTAIGAYTAALAARYDTDHVDAAFARRYVPPNWRWWLRTVHAVIAEI